MPADHNIVLSIKNIEVIYDHVILVLKGVSLDVPEGGIVALVGANGAGKTTTIKSISNILGTERGAVTKGSIEYKGERIDQLTPTELVRRGVVQVMEGRHCFEHLSVEENLLTGAYTRKYSRKQGRGAIARDLELVYSYFPRLKQRRKSQAGYTSGGEQQMIAVGRALMAKPSVILLDEPSMGLAPQLVQEIFDIVAVLNRQEGVTFLLAEQNTTMALRYATYGYILENGRVVMDGDAKSLAGTRMSRSFTSASAAKTSAVSGKLNNTGGANAGSPERGRAKYRHPYSADDLSVMSEYYDTLETRDPGAAAGRADCGGRRPGGACDK